ncbi:BH0509 family protein [Bacillus thuringiensis]|uniref:BH0509 family protein n=1 Tax=Bacillus thuringiensis TaxID=1428 RepID=UPI002853C8AD|nr:BH0509 family protein [Bacillus thuringiensis]MDR5021393.1 BH0509 family protein [Bacillus thuringiensis]
MSEKERSHLIEWIILIDEISRNALIVLNDDELEKRYMLSVKKVSVELNGFF